jgi:hypothetical protein
MSLSIDRKLPEELLDHVISLTSRETLLKLCLTSKTLNRLATLYLYATISLRETDHLPALAYLIFTSPTHAALIKSFIVSETWAKIEEQFTEWSWPRPEDPALQSVLRGKCAEYTSNEDEAHGMYQKIESGANEDAVLALLLASLPKLRRLNINFGICNGHADFIALWPRIVNGIRSSNNAAVTSTTSLTTEKARTALSVPIDIMSTGSENKYPNDPIHFAMSMHLPNLRSIYGWRLGDAETVPDPESNPFAQLSPRSCPVEYIELRASKLHEDNFSYLLGTTIPGKLKSFSYEVGCTWAWCTVEHSKIMTSLVSHRGTLETLGLSHEYYYPYELDYRINKPYPCSFTAFTALKRLNVAPVYVWGHAGFTEKASLVNPETKEMLWKALPENLEELWISRAHHQEFRDNDATIRFVPDCLLPGLDLVVGNKNHAFPKLEHLRIELPPLVWKDEWFDTLASLCGNAAANGIETTIILFDMFDRWSKLAVEQRWGWNQDVEWEPVRYSINRETAKVWIAAAEHEDLAQVLKDLKALYQKVNERYYEARREIGAMGMMCTDCQLDPAYDASRRVDLVELGRSVEKRLHTKDCWKGRSRTPSF